VSGLARRIDHVSFLVHDLATAVEFYVDVLGCEEIERPDLGFPGAWLRVDGAVDVHLVTPVVNVHAGTPPAVPTGLANHVAFAIDNHTDALVALRARGLDVREGDVGIRQMFVQDPSGNVIELIERTPPRVAR
jgi:glyoxylase I family protein